MYRGLIVVGLVLIVLASASPTPVTSSSLPHVYPLPVRVALPRIDEDLEAMVLNLINQRRVAAGLTPLMPHATIQGAARAHGREMFAWGYLTHLSRDGRTPRDRVLGRGVQVRLIGENLAYAEDAQAAHEALMASDAHRRNILYPQYRLVGVAVLTGGGDGVIVVEDFSDEGVTYHLPAWWEDPAARPTARSGRGY